jgi:hypothetical protein
MAAFCVLYSTLERGNTKQRPSCYGALFWLIAFGKLIKPPWGVCWPVGRLIWPDRHIGRLPFLFPFPVLLRPSTPGVSRDHMGVTTTPHMVISDQKCFFIKITLKPLRRNGLRVFF